MPNLTQIQQEISEAQATTQDRVRRRYLRELANHTGRDTILYASAFSELKAVGMPGIVLSVTLQDIQAFMSALHGLKGDTLDLILHSPGGSMEAAEQIVQYLRGKYRHIRAIVPQNAMSAATMLACACDEIVMGKHSAIGPIDPQVTFPTANGQFTAPAQAILDEFEQAKAEIGSDPRSIPLWVNKVQSYPHGFLSLCTSTLELAREKVAGWLDTYMFANEPVKQGRAIADWLGNANVHKTHGRPINIDLAASKGLKVVALEDDQKFQELVLSVFHATMVTFQMTGCAKMVENMDGTGLYVQVQPPMPGRP